MKFVRIIIVCIFSFVLNSVYGSSKDSVYISSKTSIYILKNTKTNILDYVILDSIKNKSGKLARNKNHENKISKSQHNFTKKKVSEEKSLQKVKITSKKNLTIEKKNDSLSNGLADNFSKNKAISESKYSQKSKAFQNSKKTFLKNIQEHFLQVDNKYTLSNFFVDYNVIDLKFSRPPPNILFQNR